MIDQSIFIQELVEQNTLLRMRVRELELLESVCRKPDAELKGSENHSKSITETIDSPLFKNILDHFPFLVYAKDCEGRFIYASQSVAKFFGYEAPQTLLGKTIHDFLPKADADQQHTNDLRVMVHLDLLQVEETVETQDGIVTFDTTKFPLFDDSKTPYAVCSVSVDMTEHKRIENILLKNQERLKDAQRIANIGNWELDLRTDKLIWSDEIYRIFEIDSKTFGASYNAFLAAIHPDDRDAVNKAYTESLEHGKPYGIAHRLLMSDGRIKYVQEQCETYYSPEGKPLRSIGTLQDITERKQAEIALLASEQKYRTLTEQMPDMIWQKDTDGVYVSCNSNYAKVCGVTVETITGHRDEDFYKPELVAKYIADDQCVTTTGQLLKTEERWEEGGEERWLQTSKVPLTNEYGNVIGTIGIARDITERRLADEQNAELLRMLEAVPNCILVHDCEGNFLYANQRTFDLHGYTAKEFMTMNLSRVCTPDSKKRISERIGEVSDRGEVSFESVHFKKDGTVLPLLIFAKKGTWGGKQVFISVQTDITERKIVEEELRETNTYHQNLLNNANAPIIVWDPQFRITRFNHAFESLTGYSEAEVLGRSLDMLFPPELTEHSMELIRGTLLGERWETVEIKILHREGAVRTVLWNSATLFASDGISPIATIAQGQDITERKRAEEELRGSEERYRSIFENVQDVYFETTLDGTILEISPSVETFSKGQYRREELIGKSLLDLFSDSKEKQALITALQDYGKVTDFEITFKNRDGSVLPCVFSSKIRLGSQVQLGLIIGSMHDISERKHAEADRLEALERLNKIADRVPGVLYQMRLRPNGSFCFPYASEAMYVISHIHPEEVRDDASKIFTLAHPDDFAELIASVRQSGQYLLPWQREFRLKFDDGTIRTVFSNAVPEREDDGSVLWHGFFTDITERKREEENLLHIEKRLRHSEKMEAIGQLAGGIAHDFNNVLGGIIGFTDLSLEYADKGSLLERNLNNVMKAAERAKNLVKQILAYSRQSDSQKSILLIKPIAIEVLELLKSTVPSSVKIEANLHSITRSILADPTQIHQVLLNLATNAIHAMSRRGTLKINLYLESVKTRFHGQCGEIAHGEYTVIEVIDTGCGMDATTVSKAFEPYYTTKPVGEGTGMGLSVVLGIVQSHDGDIQVESVVGKGTTIRIFLPVTEETISGLIDENPHNPKAGTERILFVDDEQMLVEMNSNLLESLGYTVRAVSNSRDALIVLREKSTDIDILITDYTMPGMSGIELVKEALKIRKDLPVILCTGFSNEVNRESAEALGIKKFIMKPYRAHEISNAIREVLDGKKRDMLHRQFR